VIETTTELIRERIAPTTNFIENLITVQCAYVNTNHPDFVKEMGAAFLKWSKIEAQIKVKASEKQVCEPN
jgi:dynamin 1-like protein